MSAQSTRVDATTAMRPWFATVVTYDNIGAMNYGEYVTVFNTGDDEALVTRFDAKASCKI
jgi:hypothetical protein